MSPHTKFAFLCSLLAIGCSKNSEKNVSQTSPETKTAIASESAVKSSVTDEERKQLTECADGLPSIETAKPEIREVLYAVECGAALGFDKIFNSEAEKRIPLLSETDLFCDPKSAKSAIESPKNEGDLATINMTTLGAACGHEYFGLKEDQLAYLSYEWFAFQRTTAWLVKTQAKLTGKSATDADKALHRRLSFVTASFNVSIPGPTFATASISPTGAVLKLGAEKPAKAPLSPL